MQYSALRTTIEQAVSAFIGTLEFGTGTLDQLNADDNREYPIVWMLPPSVANSFAPNGLQLQGWNTTLMVLQSSSVAASREQDDVLFNETFNIAQGLTRKLYDTFQDNTTETIQVGQLTQVFRKQDSVHIGWNVPVTINSVTDVDCCNLFS